MSKKVKHLSKIIPNLDINYKNEEQKKYHETIIENEIILCSGPAGVGKSYMSVLAALDLLKDTTNGFNNIAIITPAVEADEKLGFLPGDMHDKLSPYTFSTFYLLKKLLNQEAFQYLTQNEIINVMALAYLRGTNIDNTILIFEEAQNSTIRQMKTLLTRIGKQTKFIISGDIKQSDRYSVKNHNLSGLKFALDHLYDIPGLGIFEFSKSSIVRNPIIEHIVKRFEENGE